MADLEKKIKEYYDAKGLTEIQLHKIQRMMRKPKRRMRILLYGPIAAIFFVAVMSKITFRIIKNDAEIAEIMEMAQSDAPPPPRKAPPTMKPQPDVDPKFKNRAPAVHPKAAPDRLALNEAAVKNENRDMAGFSVSMAPEMKPDAAAGSVPSVAGGVILKEVIRLSGFAGGKDQDDKFDAELKAHLKGIDKVYRKYRKTSRSLSGMLVVRVKTGKDGAVAEVVVEENKTGSEPFAKTVSAMIKSWRFSSGIAGEKMFRMLLECTSR